MNVLPMNMMNKIGIFSDIHLGVHQNSDFWLNNSCKWADWYISILKERNIKTIFFLGDWFHSRDDISVKTINFSSRFLDKFNDFKIYMIVGNHDAWYKDTSEINSISIFRNRKNITVIEKITTLELYDKIITFCPWGTNIEEIPKCDIILGHFELENFKMNTFKVCDHGDDPYFLIKKAPLILTGHFHTRDEKEIEGSKVIYVGNPFEMDFGDYKQTKGVYIINPENLSTEFIENNITPKHIKVILSKLIYMKDPISYFEQTLKDNILKLVIDRNTNNDYVDALTSKILSYRPCELRVDYDANYNRLTVTDEDDYNLSGIDINQAIEEFVNMLDIQNKKDVINFTQSLYDKVKSSA